MLQNIQISKHRNSKKDKREGHIYIFFAGEHLKTQGFQEKVLHLHR